MKFITSLAVAASFDIVTASPLQWMWQKARRQVESQMTDVDILRDALTLEHLEDTFYKEGLKNFTKKDFKAAVYDHTVYANIEAISSHETTHVQFLTTALNGIGEMPTEQCTYDFPVTTVDEFVTLASILEGVGTSAYLGAAKQLANSVAYLTAAGSILTVEARHSSFLRSTLKESPFPQPFDDPLTPDEVHTMAHGFIVSCPAGNPTFPIKFFPALEVLTTGKIARGDVISVATPDYKLTAENKAAHLSAAFITANGMEQCTHLVSH